MTRDPELEGRLHLSMVGGGWDEVAGAVDSWLDGVLEGTLASGQRAGG